MRKILLLVLMAIFSINAIAQTKKSQGLAKKTPQGFVRCYSTEYEAQLQQKYKTRNTKNTFENWIATKISKQKTANYRVSAVRTIPVVVHVINKGENVGTGSNISDAQVISQITTLNNDYRKKSGTRGFNTNLVGADANIEFALAVRDPNGNPTNGINRISFNKDFWDEAGVETELKPNTIWDPTKYLNIWVVNFGGDLNGVLGYAQFPDASTLSGLNFPPFTATTDGVIIGYQFFGSLDDNDGSFTLDSTYGYGRTVTHEVGHWLGLRHIWGDSNCGTDYVADTPVHQVENYGCFTHPKTNSCTPPTADEMFENYMDYTDDTCMNIFTVNQVDRFNAVLLNSPRRKELLTSNALTPVTLVNNDAEISVQEVLNTECSFPQKGQLRLVNRGTNTITSSVISINDNGIVYNITWTGSLATNKEALIPISFNENSTANNISATISSVNSTTDGRTGNNTATLSYDYTPKFNTTQVKLELQLDDYGSETSWKLKNSSGTVIESGGSYPDNTSTTNLPALKTFNFSLPNNSCYTFEINDSEADGICCDWGAGYYKLTTGSNEVMKNGGQFTTSESFSFVLGTVLSAKEFNLLDLNVYPNPTTDVLNISKVSNNASYSIYNVSGQLVSKGKVSGNKVNVSQLTKGVYFIEVSEKGKTSKLKFIKK